MADQPFDFLPWPTLDRSAAVVNFRCVGDVGLLPNFCRTGEVELPIRDQHLVGVLLNGPDQIGKELRFASSIAVLPWLPICCLLNSRFKLPCSDLPDQMGSLPSAIAGSNGRCWSAMEKESRSVGFCRSLPFELLLPLLEWNGSDRTFAGDGTAGSFGEEDGARHVVLWRF
ncbi:hypothetical protein ACLOJK_030014 [Asimina triloba]